FGAEAVVSQSAGAQIAHFGLHECPQVAGGTVLSLVNGKKFVVVPDDHSGSEIIRIHSYSFVLLMVGLKTGWRTGVLSRKSPKLQVYRLPGLPSTKGRQLLMCKLGYSIT